MMVWSQDGGENVQCFIGESSYIEYSCGEGMSVGYAIGL